MLLLFTSLCVAYSFTPNMVRAEESINEPQTKSSMLSVQFLGANDFHGALSEAASLSSSLAQEKNNFINQFPEGLSMRVQAGDMVGSSPVNSSLLQDEPTIKVMNKMNFDFGTLGNHEFDEGLEEFNRILTGTAPKVGQFNLETENYPREASTQQILIANVLKKNDQTIPYNWKPYAVKEVTANQKKVQIGLIGIVTKNIPSLVSKKYHEEYTFLDEAETLAKYSKELQSQGVRAIVVIAHTGNGEAILNKLNSIAPDHSVDLYIDGHSHKEVNTTIGKTRIVQSLANGRAFSNITGTITPETNDFITTPTAKIVSVNKTLAKDQVVERIVADADQRVSSLSKQTISHALSTDTITKKENLFKESPLGNLVADAQLFIANQEGFSVAAALVNSGSLRSDLLVNPDRSITYGNAIRVQPFNNPLYVVQLSGEQLLTVLNQQYQNNQKYTLQNAGISYSYTDSANSAQPFKLIDITKKDQSSISPNQTVNVVVNEYIYTHDVFNPIFAQGQLLGILKATDTEAFIAYLTTQKEQQTPIDAKIDNRKNYIPFSELTANTTVLDKDQTQTTYIATTELTEKKFPVDSIYYQVWSTKNGTDDLKTYTATALDNYRFSATIPIANHQTAGDYVVETYAMVNGEHKKIADNTFRVGQAKMSGQISNVNVLSGTFDIVLHVPHPKSVDKINVSVYPEKNPAMKKNYIAKQQLNNPTVYKLSVSIKDYQKIRSAYKVDASLTYLSGLTTSLALTSQSLVISPAMIVGYAQSTAAISKVSNTNKESALGNLISDAQLAVAKQQTLPVDFAFTNDGGIQANLIISADKSIHYSDAQKVQPHNNELKIVSLTGKQIEEVLNIQYQNNQKYVLQLAGLTYQYKKQPTDKVQPYKVTAMKQNTGQPVDQKKLYNVVINNHLYTSTAFPQFKKGKLLKTLPLTDTETLISYLYDLKEQKQSINPKIENRKIYLK